VLEAMKMEHTLSAPAAGTVAHVGCAERAQVKDGSVLIVLVLD
jgi:3-methylcrotonyl-CoA carboxylase alpha subunit